MTAVTRLLAAGAAAAGLAASGCGVDIDGAGTAAQPASRATRIAEPVRQRPSNIRERAADELAIAGEPGSLTSRAVADFASAEPRVRPSYRAVEATEGFARLCRGEADVVEASRRISRAELSICAANGVEIQAPIQIASDAIVVATRNESDVGGDCLTVASVRAIYRPGSSVDNWRDVGFDDLSLTATGPREGGASFALFASSVLGVTSGARVADVRGDYVAQRSDDAIRRDVVGAARARRVPAMVEEQVRQARKALAARRRIYVGNAVVHVRERVLRAIRADNRLRARRKQAVSDPAALARRNLRRIDDAKRLVARRARTRFDTRFERLRATRTRELRGEARRTGVVGFVRFGYYEAYEDQLRPLEIDAGAARDAALAAADRRMRAAGLTPKRRLPAVDGDGRRIPDCIFPSQLTITTGEYPLSRQIRLYTSTAGLRRLDVRGFLGYTLAHARALAARSRLVPITDRLVADQYKVVTGSSLAEDAR